LTRRAQLRVASLAEKRVDVLQRRHRGAHPGMSLATRPAAACAASTEFPHEAEDEPVNAGTLIGGVAGGVIGHQIGRGRGNTAATIAGAIGGAVVGSEIDRRQGQATRFRITVRLDSGSSLVIDETRNLNLRVGDRVRIEDGHVYRI
jgi:outer membrane lipoprotein SlyB